MGFCSADLQCLVMGEVGNLEYASKADNQESYQ